MIQFLRKRTLPATTFPGIEFQSCTFLNCDLSGSNLSGAKLHDCRFDGCNMSMANVHGCTLNNVAFSGKQVYGCAFQRCTQVALQSFIHQYHTRLYGVYCTQNAKDHVCRLLAQRSQFLAVRPYRLCVRQL